MNNNWHEHFFRVNYKDTDQMAVAHHGNYVEWFEIGRTEMMRSAGIAYAEMEALGLLLPVIDLEIKYVKSAHYDDLLAVYTKIDSFTPVRLAFNYEVRRVNADEMKQIPLLFDEGKNFSGTTPKGELLTKGTTKHMWVNEAWRPARLSRKAPEVYELLHELTEVDA